MNAIPTPPAGPVCLVGTGLGPVDLLTVRALHAVRAARTVLVDGAPDPSVAAELAHDAVVVDVADLSPREVAQRLVAAAADGRAVVRLLPGDPLVDGVGAEEGEALADLGMPYDVACGVSLLFGTAAHMGVPLHAADRPGLLVLPDHRGRPSGTGPDEGDPGAGTRLARVTADRLGALLEPWRAAGADPDLPAAFTWDGGTPDQTTVVGTVDTLDADVALYGRSDPGVLVVGADVARRPRLSWFEGKPLFGWHVLVPRTKEQAGSLSEQLRSYGAVPVEVPTIAVEPPRTAAPMERAIRGLVGGRFQWCVFTSTNAVRAVREKFEEFGLDARAFAGVKVAAIGEVTAGALRDWGIEPELVPSGEQSSEGLLADFAPFDEVYDPIGRVLLPRADIATEALVEGLTALGWEVEDVTAYRTVRAAPPPAPIRDAIKGGGFDAVLFTSSSTVRNLVGIAGKPHASTVIAVIGPATAETALELGLRVDVHSPEPSVHALAGALAAFGYQRREHGLPPRPAARAPKPPKPRTRVRRRS